MSEATEGSVSEGHSIGPQHSEQAEAAIAEPSEGAGTLHTARSVLTDVRRSSRAAAQAVVDRTRIAARATDEYVHDSPWVLIGASALLAAAVGYLIGRR